MEAALVAFIAASTLSLLLASWITLLQRRLLDFISQQEKYWQRHMEDHPRR